MDSNSKEQSDKKQFHYRNGRLYFSRDLERRLFFAGTIVMVTWGFLVKVGIL